MVEDVWVVSERDFSFADNDALVAVALLEVRLDVELWEKWYEFGDSSAKPENRHSPLRLPKRVRFLPLPGMYPSSSVNGEYEGCRKDESALEERRTTGDDQTASTWEVVGIVVRD